LVYVSIPIIGVISYNYRIFESWKREVGFSVYGRNSLFIPICNDKDALGRAFTAIELPNDGGDPLLYLRVLRSRRVSQVPIIANY